jgi:hypothetical protein
MSPGMIHNKIDCPLTQIMGRLSVPMYVSQDCLQIQIRGSISDLGYDSQQD